MAGANKLMTSGGGGVQLQPASNIATDVIVNIPSVNGNLVNTGSTGQITAPMMANAGAEFGMRNRIINGAMQVWQRGTSHAAAGYGSVDRWTLNSNNTTLSRSTDVPSGFRYSAQFVGASTPNAQITQKIESLNCDDLVGEAVTVSFWAKSTAGSTQLGVYLQHASSQDNFGANINVGLSTQFFTLTSTWVRYSITFTTNAPSGIANGLQLGLYRAGTESSTTYITGVQLEKGSTATSFDYRPYGTELQLCQRYYYRYTNTTGAVAPISTFQAYNTTSAFGKFFDLPVVMRSNPTVNNGGAVQPCNSAGTPQTAFTGGTPIGTQSTIWTGGYVGSSNLAAGNATVIYLAANGWFDASAEL